ncbi:PLAC8 family-domain-containing protein [Russula dissimulans]|nr:PLAC8 family-domain-containing protein [Russula dissimulans]
MAVGGNKNSQNCQIGVDGKRKWSYGLLDCFSACGLCCWATWCPCVVYSTNKQRLRQLRYQGTSLQGGGDTCDDHCLIHGGLSVLGCSWVLQLHERAEARDRYGIRGSAVGDCFTSLLCCPCALTQERREIELEEDSLRLS